MFNLKIIGWDAPAGDYVIPAPYNNDQSPGPDDPSMAISKSEDKVTEFCDCFFCTRELSDEQIFYALNTDDFMF